MHSKELYKLPVVQGMVYGITKYEYVGKIYYGNTKTMKWNTNDLYKQMERNERNYIMK